MAHCSEIELLPCPFCGGKAKLSGRFVSDMWWDDVRRDRYRFQVICNRCHARGGVAGGLVVGARRDDRGIEDPFYVYGEVLQAELEAEDKPEWATTREELKKQAVELWNRRAEHGVE